MRNSIFKKMTPKLRRGLIGTTGLLVVLIFWGVLSMRYHSLILPSPGETFQAIKGLQVSGDLWVNIMITVRRTLLGYSLALFTGLFLALLLKGSSYWQDFFRPLITIVQVIPPVIWLILAVIWFGIA